MHPHLISTPLVPETEFAETCVHSPRGGHRGEATRPHVEWPRHELQRGEREPRGGDTAFTAEGRWSPCCMLFRTGSMRKRGRRHELKKFLRARVRKEFKPASRSGWRRWPAAIRTRADAVHLQSDRVDIAIARRAPERRRRKST